MGMAGVLWRHSRLVCSRGKLPHQVSRRHPSFLCPSFTSLSRLWVPLYDGRPDYYLDMSRIYRMK